MPKLSQKIIVILISFCVVFAFLAYDFMFNNNVFGLKSLNSDQYEKFISDKEYQYNPDIELYLNEENHLPYVTDLYSYLLSVNLNNLNGIEISTNQINYSALLVIDAPLEKYLESNTPVQICIYNENYYDVRDIRLTTLPTMFITTDDNQYSTMQLIDPLNERALYQIENSEIVYDVRGSSTIAMPKHHYRMTLKNGGSNNKMSLLGMRKDDDWILNSFVVDESASIEPLALEIWNSLCPQYKHELRHIELIINGMYQGYYGLMERVDFKTFGADKNKDLFIKINTWQSNVLNPSTNHDISYEDVHEPINDVCLIDEFEVDNCSEENFSEVIKVLKELHAMPYSNIAIDYDSFAAHELFIGLTCANDNTYKNQRVLANFVDGSWKLYKSNWDNDLCFTTYNLDDYTPSVDITVPEYLKDDSNYLQTKHQLYKDIKSIFNEEYILGYLDDIYTMISGSGAAIRDNNLWNETYDGDFQSTFNKLYDLMPDYINVITNYYDEYFKGLGY